VKGVRSKSVPAARIVLLGVLCAVALGATGGARADLLNPATTTVLTVSPNPVAAGDPVTLTATVTGTGGNPPGEVRFANGSTVIGAAPATPVPGSTTQSQATLVTSFAGSVTITATYVSSDVFNFFNSTSPGVLLTVIVPTIHNTTTTLTADPPTVTTGQPETLTATVRQSDGGTGIPTGFVTFRDNDVLLGTQPLDATGKAAITVGSFIAGTHTITADYSGDVFDHASGATLTLVVSGGGGAVQTTTTAHATPNPISVGQSTLLSAHVVQTGTQTPPPASASVIFTTNGVFLGEALLDANGDASVSVGGWIAGSYVIKASYLGDVSDLPSSAEFTLLVAPAGTTDLALTSLAGPASVLPGGTLTYVAQVTNLGPAPAAAVLRDPLPADTTFTSGSAGCAAAGGVVSCDLGTLAPGAVTTVTIVLTLSDSTSATSITNTATVYAANDFTPGNDSASVTTSVTQLGCPAVGSVHGNEKFTQVQVEVDADCDLDKKSGKIFLHHAHLHVKVGGATVIDAKQADFLRVAISGADATLTGTWAGTPFTVTLHDGGHANKDDDTLRVVYGTLDTSTLATKHGNVHIENR
jgi:uncharacterized repeat protein (TIGR01451 family)